MAKNFLLNIQIDMMKNKLSSIMGCFFKKAKLMSAKKILEKNIGHLSLTQERRSMAYFIWKLFFHYFTTQ